MKKVVEILNDLQLNGFHLPGGTDKASDHSYDEAYDQILMDYRQKEIDLLEIGVQYGGSLLLWQEFFPLAKIIGLDINSSIFDEKVKTDINPERCEYHIIDAYTENALSFLKEKKPNGFDVIIEDGPHSLESQIYTVKNYTKLLKTGGILIIEDIQNMEHCQVLKNSIENSDCSYFEVIDLRSKKNRWDDIMFVILK